MSPSDSDERLRAELTNDVRAIRERERRERTGGSAELSREALVREQRPLTELPSGKAEATPATSPDRDDLNTRSRWDVALAMVEPAEGRWGRLLTSLRRPLQRVVRFALGPVVERQVQMNSAQVHFDNELVRYVDERFDRLSRHYDGILGLHGKRMEEVDERHLILQQELIRHVHDLVQRIEFVFESAEQNHLYLEGMLRETKEEIESLIKRWERLSQSKL